MNHMRIGIEFYVDYDSVRSIHFEVLRTEVCILGDQNQSILKKLNPE